METVKEPEIEIQSELSIIMAQNVLLSIHAPIGKSNVHIFYVPNWTGPEGKIGMKELEAHSKEICTSAEHGSIHIVYYVKNAKVPLGDFHKKAKVTNKIFRANTVAVAIRMSKGEYAFKMYPFR